MCTRRVPPHPLADGDVIPPDLPRPDSLPDAPAPPSTPKRILFSDRTALDGDSDGDGGSRRSGDSASPIPPAADTGSSVAGGGGTSGDVTGKPLAQGVVFSVDAALGMLREIAAGHAALAAAQVRVGGRAQCVVIVNVWSGRGGDGARWGGDLFRR